VTRPTPPYIARLYEMRYDRGGFMGVERDSHVLELLLGYFEGLCVERGDEDGDPLAAYVRGWLNWRTRYRNPELKRAYQEGRMARKLAKEMQ